MARATRRLADDLVRSGLAFPVVHAEKAIGAGLGARGFAGTVMLEAPGVGEDGEPDLPLVAEGLRRLRELVAA
jgi:hypothetical protein